MILGTDDLSNLVEKKIDLDQKECVRTLSGFCNNKRFTVIYLGRVVEDSVDNTCNELIDMLTELDIKGYLVGFLGPSLSGIRLSVNDYLVVSYVALTDQGLASLETGKSII